MNLSLYNFKVFKAVYECRGVSSAAEGLFISQSAVSHQLKILNEHFGSALFERQGRNIVPTETGHLVYERSINILNEYNELQSSMNILCKGETGDIVLGGSLVVGTYMLPDIICKFNEKFPTANFKLHVLETSELIKEIASGDICFGVALAKIDNSYIKSRKISKDEVVIVASSDYDEKLLPKTIEELAEKPFIISLPKMQGRKVYDEILNSYGIEQYANIVMEVGHPEGIKQMVRQGLGFGILNRSAVAQDLELGLLKEVKLRCAKMEVNIYLVHRANKRFTPIEKKFIDFIEVQDKIVNVV